MISPTMLYRLGNSVIIWGTPMDTLIVDENDIASYLDAGWFLHPNDVNYQSTIETINIDSDSDGVDVTKPRRGRPPKFKE